MAQEDAQLKRVRWRCRRGTKELDALYGWWLAERWEEADSATRNAFDDLLGSADPDLWDWTMGWSDPPRSDWQAIINEIRAHHHV